MALQVYSAAPRTSVVQSSSPYGVMAKQLCVGGDYPQLMRRKERRLSMSVGVRASLDATEAAAAAVAEVGRVTEVTKDTFWPIVNAAGDKTVVVDMYTQWCGPCKIMAPKFEQLSGKYNDVIFLKLDCNQENRPLAKELGIKVVPTFKILKNSKIVKEVTGAKFDDLVLAIDTARSS
ncbi:thioredoxin F-type 1 [Perilla frutescens var. hirtella]|uniref:Thioredoxin F-type 1 n=1 Tax=Perilla frutescens var. hirtella TaxID=608512 RepID=A0AAD4JIB6_PERFH|nr:thioredoxin F-type 1 [Perilla frutescens var. hirtella]KAH6769526.1 thioredoxin F-type 1 [Perilla frutescens var. frutescens]KAH6812714.1 thioredoxin F-type 1 [Perilla frutescens var. frutescens]KAH6834388.1 thioredoxin F-type 1 [Perilla frutescens var. hirtella]